MAAKVSTTKSCFVMRRARYKQNPRYPGGFVVILKAGQGHCLKRGRYAGLTAQRRLQVPAFARGAVF